MFPQSKLPFSQYSCPSERSPRQTASPDSFPFESLPILTIPSKAARKREQGTLCVICDGSDWRVAYPCCFFLRGGHYRSNRNRCPQESFRKSWRTIRSKAKRALHTGYVSFYHFVGYLSSPITATVRYSYVDGMDSTDESAEGVPSSSNALVCVVEQVCLKRMNVRYDH